MKTILLTMTTLFMLSANCAIAQVTIGSLDDPQSFSILELEGGGTRGLRLPQLDSDQRDALNLGSLSPASQQAALGLQIFNTDTECVETWNGVEWIQACYNNTPTPLSIAFDNVITCGITQDGNTFTAPDLKAVKYEFFVGGTSQGKQKGNSINIDDSQLPAEVNVKYYYPASFLKPKMLPVEGNNGVAWHHTDATTTTTTAAIPDLNMSETPITQAQFEYVFPDRAAVTTIGYNQPSYNYFSCSTNTNYAPSSAKPADMINWYDAIAYCNKLSAMEGKELCYAVSGVDDWLHLAYTSIPSETEENWDAATCNFTKNGYRLPTSSEWEYAARGGTANTSPVYSGSTYSDSGDDTEALDTVGWYNGNNIGNSGTVTYGTKAVKTKVANAFGLYDMSGNVCEWCWNWGNEEGGYPIATPTGDPVASTGSSARVRRGGSWSNSANLCRVSSRNISGIPYIRNNSDGFRVVCK